MALKDLFKNLKKQTTETVEKTVESANKIAVNTTETVKTTVETVKEAVAEKAEVVKEAVDAGIAEAKKDIVTATETGMSFVDEFRAAGKKAAEESEKETIEAIARDVIKGKYGNGDDRKKALAEAGYDYKTVQAKVNQILHPDRYLDEDGLVKVEDVARDVIKGKYGNGDARKKALAEAGYDYKTVQNKVNEILHSKK